METAGQHNAKDTHQKSVRLLRIGEVAKLLDLQTSVLRYWETEFPFLAPQRTEKGQRLYTPENVALVRKVRTLLHEKGMTIEGARRVLEGGKPVPRAGKKQDAINPETSADTETIPTKTRKKVSRQVLENMLEDLHNVRFLLTGQQTASSCQKKTGKSPVFLSLLDIPSCQNPHAHVGGSAVQETPPAENSFLPTMPDQEVV